VTAVARSNYDIVQSELIASVRPNLNLITTCPPEEGTHILSEKYGDVKGWKPFRGS
jgi:hypothetical protein